MIYVHIQQLKRIIHDVEASFLQTNLTMKIIKKFHPIKQAYFKYFNSKIQKEPVLVNFKLLRQATYHE